jgi:glycosyl transferase, family 25
MKAYVINMERSVNRRISMEQQLDKLGLNYEIVNAVDGSLIPDSEIKTSEFSKSEIGCMRSHCKVYELMQHSDEPYALVLEDDVAIAETELARMLDSIGSQFSKETVTLLTYFGSKDKRVVLKKIKNVGHIQNSVEHYYICQPTFANSLARAGAYVVSKECAKKMLEFHKNDVRCRADEWEVYYDNDIMPIVHCIYPMPVTENYDHGSEINYTRNGIEALGKKFITWSIYNKIPILTYLFKKRRESYSNRHKNIELEN